MLSAEARLDLQRRYYPGLHELIFGAVEEALAGHLKDDSTVLDAGCSAGTWILQPHRSRLKRMVGADVYLPVKAPGMPFVLADLSNMAFADGTFDLIVCYNVIEHLPQPKLAFSEFVRVLKSGGALIFKTPSLHAPLIALSRAMPYALHRTLKRELAGAEEAGIFPTYYRCNTPGALESSLRQAGFRRKRLWIVDQTYEYLAFSRLSYAAGLLYSRGVQGSLLRWLGTGIVGVYVKPAPGAVRPRVASSSLAMNGASEGDEAHR